MQYISRFLRFWGWLFFAGSGFLALCGLFIHPLIAFGWLIWALVFLPPLQRVTAQYGWKANVFARLALFAMAFVLIGAATPPKPTGITAANSPPEVPKAPAVVAPSPSPSASSAPVAEKSWKQYLPDENQALRATLEADPFLAGWLQNQDVWIGYAAEEELLGQGFFVNTSLNHNGQGKTPDIPNPRGSCSLFAQTGQIPAMICGKSAMTWQWGIQSEEARRSITALMSEPEPEIHRTKSELTHAEEPEFNAEIIDPPTNCRSDGGTEFAVVTVFPRGVVAVDVSNIRNNQGNWYREIYNNCWIHESQLSWLSAPPISDGRTEQRWDSTHSGITSSYGTTSSSSPSRCNSPDDRDSAGRRCGARASTVRQNKRR